MSTYARILLRVYLKQSILWWMDTIHACLGCFFLCIHNFSDPAGTVNRSNRFYEYLINILISNKVYAHVALTVVWSSFVSGYRVFFLCMLRQWFSWLPDRLYQYTKWFSVLFVLDQQIIHLSFSFFAGPTEVINCYLLSLAFADLLCGLIIVPLSVYPALTGEWLYGDMACRFVGFLEVTLWSITVYTFMWISVDRYLAIRKPLRYETVQTKTR